MEQHIQQFTEEELRERLQTIILKPRRIGMDIIHIDPENMDGDAKILIIGAGVRGIITAAELDRHMKEANCITNMVHREELTSILDRMENERNERKDILKFSRIHVAERLEFYHPSQDKKRIREQRSQNRLRAKHHR